MVDGNESGNESEENQKIEEEIMVVDIGISLWENYDLQESTKYLETLFKVADKLGKSLHEEKLSIGEAILIIYFLEKGALDSMKNDEDNKNIDCAGDLYHALADDNKQRIDFIANMILRNKMKK